jgi:VWFA-related protein
MTSIPRNPGSAKTSAVALAAVLGLALVRAPEGAAAAGRQAGGQIREEVTVTVKLLQAYVTGKGGKPVTDLTAADFEITDNGQKVAVTHFEKHLAGGDDLAPVAPVEAPRLARKFFFFFDFAFTDPRSSRKAREAALHFMDTALRPGDEVGLMSYSPTRGLTIHEYLTVDHAKVRTIIDAFGLRSVAGRAETLTNFLYADEILWMRDTDETGTDPTADAFFREQAEALTGGAVQEGRRQGYIDQARQFAQTFASLGRALRYVPGWKNIILFSAGISRALIYGERRGLTAPIIDPSNPEATAAAMAAYDNAQSHSGVRTEFSEALKELKNANSPIYAIDCTVPTGEMDINNPIGTSVSAREFTGKDSLVQLAGESGGKYFSSAADYKNAMNTVQDITSAFYVLGYGIPTAWDGAFHRIKVRVLRPGCKVVSQTGYYNPKPFKSYNRFERLLQMTELALSDNPLSQVPEEAPMSVLPFVAGGWPYLVAFAGLPKATAAAVVGERAQAYLLLYDEEQGRSAIKNFRVKPTEGGPRDSLAVFAVRVKPGRYSCRIIVQNGETGLAARGSAALSFSNPVAAAIWMDPPLLLTEASGWADLGAPPEETLPALYGYDPARYAPLLGPLPAGPQRMFAALRVSLGQPEMELDFTAAETLGETTAEVPVTVIAARQEKSLRWCLLELALGDLQPGRHSLVITAKDKAGVEGNRTAAPFTVK